MILLALALALPNPHALSAADRSKIQSYVADRLLDGEGARWRWPLEQEPQTYCGWINAKNRVGAYTGWRQYYVLYARKTSGQLFPYFFRVSDDDPASEDARRVEKMCGGQGYDTSGPPASPTS